MLSSAVQTSDSEEALGQLCRIYWRPILAFICRRGYEVSDAQDLTQGFFVRIFGGKLLATANPSRGPFRSLLLKARHHELRQRYRTLLRREVARTVTSEEELEDEIRYLCRMLATNTD